MDNSTVARVVDSLVQAQLLDPMVRARAVDVVAGSLDVAAPEPGPAPVTSAPRGMPKLVEVVAYLGGALVLAAGALFLVQEWGSLSFAARVTLLAVVAVVLGVAGVLSAGDRDTDGPDPRTDARRRLAGSLLTGAGVAAAFLVGYVLDEALNPTYDQVYWPAIAGAGVGVVVAGAGYRLARTAVGVVGLMAGLLTAVGTLADGADEDGREGDALGVAFFAGGVLWLVATEAGLFGEITIARALGVGVALFGAQVPAINSQSPAPGWAMASRSRLRSPASPSTCAGQPGPTWPGQSSRSRWWCPRWSRTGATDRSVRPVGCSLPGSRCWPPRSRVTGCGSRRVRDRSAQEPTVTVPDRSLTVSLIGCSWDPRVRVQGSVAPTLATT